MEEIRGDFETFAGAFSSYAQALTKVGLKAGKTPTATQLAALATAAKSFNAPRLQAAEQHLAAWGQKNCGVGMTTTGLTSERARWCFGSSRRSRWFSR